jgi:Protein of unknown function (DUF3309)
VPPGHEICAASGIAAASAALEPGVLMISIGAILLIILIVILVGVLPTWPYSDSWGYGPTGIVGVLVVVLVLAVVLGAI